MPKNEKTNSQKAISECQSAYYKFKEDLEIGDYVYNRPIPSDMSSIANFGLAHKDRKFPLHDRDFILTVGGDELTDFLDQENYIFDNGFYFYNGNQLEYVTGKHYFMLQYWVLQSKEGGVFKTPNFIDTQRDMFYHWDSVENDKECLGAVWGTYRGGGKTSVGGAICYMMAILLEGAKCAIQSKSNDDAIEVFMKIQESWQRLPEWLKPTDTGESKRSNALLFQNPQKKSSKGEVKEYKYTLDSWIKPFAAKNTALDGLRFRFGYFDEEGKVPKGVADVDERWDINARCFISLDEVIGKSLHTTTVEDMERLGGAKFKRIWDDSDVKTLDELLGRTTSGLRRFFIPSDYGYKVDEFGYSKREEARAIHKAEMSKRTGKALISYRRKFPLYESDMWLMEAGGSPWNQTKIHEQVKYNDDTFAYNSIRRGNFYWKNPQETEVGFEEDDNGRFKVSWMPSESDRNSFEITESGRTPSRDYVKIGVDPTDHKAPQIGAGSNNGAYAVLKPNLIYKNKTHKPVCEYIYRQEHPLDFSEDMRLMATFYSAEILIENNRGTVMLRHFENKGCENYLMYNPMETDWKKKIKERGFYNSPNGTIRNSLISITKAHIIEEMGFLGDGEYADIPFKDLLDDLLAFESNNWTPYDATVAYMIAIAACKTSGLIDESTIVKTTNDFDVTQLHTIYQS